MIEIKRQDIFISWENERELWEQQHQRALKQLEDDFSAERKEILADIVVLHNSLFDIQSKVSAAVDAAKRFEKLKDKDNFYKITFSESEFVELEELSIAIAKLRNPLPFRKAVYDVYYKNKINNLVKKIVGKDKVSGIYKITNTENEKTYVGQSVDIANR